jgi:hypothetical protein
MPDLNVTAEEFLIEHGIAKRRSRQRRRILTCIACQWNSCIIRGMPPVVFGYQIMQCTGEEGGLIYPALRQLEGSVITSFFDMSTTPARKYYQPVMSEFGLSFMKLLQAPSSCPLADIE